MGDYSLTFREVSYIGIVQKVRDIWKKFSLKGDGV